MNRYAWPTLSASLLLMLSLFSTPFIAAAADSSRHQRSNDVDIYLAVIPAEITQQDSAMQASFKQHETRYHVIVALFDAASGKRITNARVHATVSMLGEHVKQDKNLDPMLIMDVASYGNYFVMSEPGKYRLRFKLEMPTRKYDTTADFQFDNSTD